MGGTPDIGTALAQLLQQSGGAPPAASPTSPAPTPTASPSPMAGVLSQAMQSLNTTPFKPTPSSGGGLDPSMHPVLAKVIQALAGGAQSYGWTAMPPSERLERTQMEQQKAETMARLAQAGVAQEQTARWRQSEAETAQERARSYQESVENRKKAEATKAQIAQDRVNVQREMMEVRKAIGEGRIKLGHDQLNQRATQFEQMFKLRAEQLHSVEEAKVELMEQGNMIKQGFLDVARGALSQRGTVEGAQIAQKLQTLQLEHPILSQIIGLDDVAGMVGESRGAQIPGVAPTATPLAPAATAPLPSAPTPQKPRAAKPAARPAGGATHTWTPQGGVQPIGATGNP